MNQGRGKKPPKGRERPSHRRPPGRVEIARQRMLDANTWEARQQAGADYWVIKHPEAARFLGADPERVPTVTEFLELAHQLELSQAGVPETWRSQPQSPERIEYQAQIGWFHGLMNSLYGPVNSAIERLRRGDPAGIETAVRFLEADPYCFRSGYAKADLIRFLKRVEVPPDIARRLRAVVLNIVAKPTRREFRSYITLARAVDSPELRAELRRLADSTEVPGRRHARWMLVALGEPEWEDDPTPIRHRVPVGWTRFAEPEFGLEFFYPRKLLSGALTTLEVQPRPDGRAVRVSTPDSSDVYVELREVADRQADEALRTLMEDVTARFEDAEFGELEQGHIGEMPAIAITFRLADRLRRALFSVQSRPSYWVAYDPRSMFNDLIVMSIQPRDAEGSGT